MVTLTQLSGLFFVVVVVVVLVVVFAFVGFFCLVVVLV
jgi:hypothetical protein